MEAVKFLVSVRNLNITQSKHQHKKIRLGRLKLDKTD